MSSSMVSIKIEGLRELNALLERFPPEVTNFVAPRAIAAGSRVYRNAARASAPVRSDPPGLIKMKSGKTRRPGNLKRAVKVLRQWKQGHTLKCGAFVSKRGFYGHILEIGGGRLHAARPWFRPSVDGAHTEALRQYREAMANGMMTYFARQAVRVRSRGA